MSTLIEVTQVDGVAELRFNRPEVLNALNVAMAEAFAEETERLLRDESLRVLLITGAGRAFMAGGDLKSFWATASQERGTLSREIITPVNRALLSLYHSPIISIAAAQGAVAGAGMSILMGTDLAIAATDATFNFAYGKVAASPDCGGSFWLTRLVGWRRAMQIALLSETLSASQALDWGLVTQLTEAADLLAAARSVALRLSQGPQGSYAAMKRLFRSAAVNSFEEQLNMERESFAALSEQADFGRALEGFFAGKTRAGLAR